MDKGGAREKRAPYSKMTTNPTVATTEMKPDWSVMAAKGISEEGQASDSAYTSDVELVRACVDGKPGAFDVLMQRHQRHVYQLCYRFAGNHEDASDLSQDVFLRVHRGLGRFKGNAALSTWLYRIAVNVSLNYVSLTRPKTEEVEPERLFDRRSASPAELVARGRALGDGESGHRQIARQTTGHLDPACVSRSHASRDCGDFSGTPLVRSRPTSSMRLRISRNSSARRRSRRCARHTTDT